MKLRVVTGPAAEPVTLDDVKAYCRVAHDDDDVLLTSLIEAARRRAELHTRRAFVTQTLELALDGQPCRDYVDLPYPPLASVTSVKYVDGDDVETTWSDANYHVDTIGEPGRVALVTGGAWPDTGDLRSVNSILIRYVAGYGAASAVPDAIQTAIMEIARKMYDADMVLVKDSMEASLLAPFRILRVA